ncbi:MAG: DNA-3-methyladenine glycosylase 2 family protein, partial [Actinomycetota bacterium]|nr:DNA-3-methyladenine glycosylase 2 family protein [Actinomycetota bacterium]
DPLAVDTVLGADPRLAPWVRANQGMRIPGVLDGNEALVRAIVGQGGTGKSARAQLQRLVDELGDELPDSFYDVPNGRNERSRITKLFPTPATVASHAHSIVRGPRAQTDTLVRVCEALADGSLQVDIADTREAMTKRLRSIKGIGPWTADYLALRLLGNPDVHR